MKFDLLFESIMKKTLREGGNAIAGVDRIEKKRIAGTVNMFKRKVLVPFFGEDPGEKMFLLGSTGKKPDSGDIDIGIDARELREKSILMNLIKLNELCARAGFNSCINTVSFNMLHVAFPQYGEDKLVQIDVLFTLTPKFTKFFMHSPAYNETRYKGAHRNCLLNAILYVISFKPIMLDKDGTPLKWEQLTLTDSGLYREVKTLVDENGKRLLYKDTDEVLEEQYAKSETSKKISDDVDFTVKFILGNSFTEADINSFENLYQIVTDNENFKYKNRSDEILKQTKKVLQQAKNRLAMPDELKKLH